MAWVVTWTAQVAQAGANGQPISDLFTFTGQYIDMNTNLGSTDFTAAASAVSTQFSAALTAQYGTDLGEASQ
jgi:hypothetical protein